MSTATASASATVLFSELVLSLYPILIKTVDTNLFTQILARFIVFPVLAIAFGSATIFKSIWHTPHDIFTGILGGVLNLAHIATSYGAFKALPVGTAISLFYLYPLFNIMAGAVFFGESLNAFSVILIAIAFFGAYLIATSSSKTAQKETHTRGVALALLAAVTETLIFVFAKSSPSPFYTVNHLYPFGLLFLGIYSIFNKTTENTVDTSQINWAKLIGFNALLGFTGYFARFYAIPKISVLLFSLLSFFGVSFGYLWGILFTADKPTVRAVIGSGCIVGSIGLLRYYS